MTARIDESGTRRHDASARARVAAAPSLGRVTDVSMRPRIAARHGRRRAAVAIALVALAACAYACSAARYPACGTGMSPAVADTLYFGTARPTGVVSADEWRRFVAEIVTPQFPDGLTVWEAAGQWRDRSGGVRHERSYVLHLIHRPRRADDASVQTIVRRYKQRFDQDAVLHVQTPACVSY